MPPRPPTAPPSPPPTAFSFNYMSGNFDYPIASTTPPPPPPSIFTRRSRIDADGGLHALHRSSSSDNESSSAMPPRPSRITRQLRRPLLEDRDRQQDWESASGLLRPPLPPSLPPNRPRATPSQRYLRRSHARLRDQRSDELYSPADMSNSSDDPSVPNPFLILNGGVVPRANSPSLELELSRRTKRRKIRHDHVKPSPYDGFRYGYKGQVVSGRLKMEIVSCDGGEYEKSGPSGLSYPVHNVLKNDTSVYCSERSRCNLLLKHIGEMPFTLEKVVIRAPNCGFTAPVQEGMIFVAMSSEDLLNNTAGYQIEYDQSSGRTSPIPSSHDDEQLSLHEAIEDPYVLENSRHRLQEAMEERIQQIQQLRLQARRRGNDPITRPTQHRQRVLRGDDDEDDSYIENCDFPPTESYAPPAGVSAPTPPPFAIHPPFTVSTETEEESDSNEEVPSPAIRADRLRRESRWRPDSDDEADDSLSRFPPPSRAYALDLLDNNGDRWRSQRDVRPIRATRLRTPSRIEPKDSTFESDNLLAPHAQRTVNPIYIHSPLTSEEIEPAPSPARLANALSVSPDSAAEVQIFHAKPASL